MTLVIAWSSFTALQHSCILYCCLLGGMCVHFKFPGLARVYNIYIASMCIRWLTPRGTFILGSGTCCWPDVFAVLIGSVTGRWEGRTGFWDISPLVLFYSVYSLPLTLDPCAVLSLGFVAHLWFGFILRLFWLFVVHWFDWLVYSADCSVVWVRTCCWVYRIAGTELDARFCVLLFLV